MAQIIWESNVADQPITMQELQRRADDDSNLQEEIVKSLRRRIQNKISTTEIPKLLDDEINAMV